MAKKGNVCSAKRVKSICRKFGVDSIKCAKIRKRCGK